MKEVIGVAPKRLEELEEFFHAWGSGALEVEGASRGRGVTLEIPQQLHEADLDGAYWTTIGNARRSPHRDM